MYFKFSSLSRKDIGYAFHSTNDLWDKWYHHPNPLALAIGEFDTYGDGMTQHSPTVATSADHFADALASLASHLLENPDQCAGFVSSCAWPSPTPINAIVFALSVRYKPGKRQYYSVSERKVSTADSKRFDRRWVEVPDYADGTVVSAFRLLWSDSMDLVQRVALYDQIHECAFSLDDHTWSPEFEDYFKLADKHQARAAFRMMDAIVEAARSSDRARRVLDSYRHNLQVAAPAAVAV